MQNGRHRRHVHLRDFWALAATLDFLVVTTTDGAEAQTPKLRDGD